MNIEYPINCLEVEHDGIMYYFSNARVTGHDLDDLELKYDSVEHCIDDDHDPVEITDYPTEVYDLALDKTFEICENFIAWEKYCDGE
jgi:hypothetical protein